MKPNGPVEIEALPLLEVAGHPALQEIADYPGRFAISEPLYLGRGVQIPKGTIPEVVVGVSAQNLQMEEAEEDFEIDPYTVTGSLDEVPYEAEQVLNRAHEDLQKAAGNRPFSSNLDKFRSSIFRELSREASDGSYSEGLMGGLAVYQTQQGYVGGAFVSNSLRTVLDSRLQTVELTGLPTKYPPEDLKELSRELRGLQNGRDRMSFDAIVDLMIKTSIAKRIEAKNLKPIPPLEPAEQELQPALVPTRHLSVVAA